MRPGRALGIDAAGLTIQLNPRRFTAGGSPPGFCARSSASNISVNNRRTSASVHSAAFSGTPATRSVCAWFVPRTHTSTSIGFAIVLLSLSRRGL